MAINITDLWQAAAVLLGLQLVSCNWRIRREADMEARGERTWLPVADCINLLAMLILVFGVFVVPTVWQVDTSVVRMLFGLAAILFVGHAFTLAGHYQLYWPPQECGDDTEGGRPYCTTQEVLAAAAVVSIGYIWLWILRA